jgi:hypothetical protein
MSATKKRKVYRITLNAKANRWECKRGKTLVATAYWKTTLVGKMRRYCRGLLESGVLSQLVIHGMDGRIQTEHTYGRDPKRSKG